MSQTHPANPLTETALSTFRSDVSNAMACYLTSFSGASAPTSPAPANGRLWYDTVNGTLNAYIGGSWQTLPIKAYFNFGTTTKANATGDLAAGLTGSYAWSWDVATGTMKIYSVADAVRVSLDSAGFMNLGSVTDAAAIGDLATGLTGAARMFYDQSLTKLYLYNSFNVATAIFDADAGAFGAYDSAGARVLVSGSSGALTIYDATPTQQHFLGFNGVAFNQTLAICDFTVSGADREVFSVDASDNSVEITGMYRGVPEAVTISSGTATITSCNVMLTGEGAAADDLVTIAAGTGVTFRDGMEVVFRTNQTITFKDGTGNMQTNVDQAVTITGVVIMVYRSSTAQFHAGVVRLAN